MSEYNFGYEESVNPQQTEEDSKNVPNGQENINDLNSNTNPVNNINDEVKTTTSEEPNPNEEKETKPYLEKGTVVEFENNKYTVSDNGDLVDDSGNVFKKADEVKSWVESQNVEKDTDISLENIQNIVGIEITDDNDKPLTFDNTPQGIADYLNAVIETSKEEIAVDTVNALFTKYPFLENAINFYEVNGSFDGFSQVKDRRSVKLEDNNEAQQEAIIREAWAEEKRHGNVEDYIKFLKSNDTLYDAAKAELDGLKSKDEAYFKSIKEESERTEKERAEISANYWNAVKETIDKRVIGKYKIPETIVINSNGKRTSATPDDFFNYVYQVDKNGKSRYMKDLEAISPSDRLNDELIRAYITFSGGSFENLVNMVINEQKVNTIKIKSNNSIPSKTKITPPAKKTTNDIDFGY